MLRVLHIQPVAERGGSDRALAALIGALPRDEFETHVVVPDVPPLAEAYRNVHVVPMRRITTSATPLYWLGYALAWPVVVVRLVRMIRRLRIDVVHTNSLHSWYGWAAALITRKPHVWSAREIVAQSGAALAVERFLVRHFATSVVAISGAVASQLDAKKTWVFSEGVDETRFRPVRTGSFRAEHGISPDTFLVGAAGRIDTWKGFDVLLDAWAKVARPGLELVVAGGAVPGKESYEHELRARAQATDAVRWIGPVGDLSAFYPDLDLFVMPSTLPEPLGLVMPESLACGTRVIATDHGGPPEVLAGHPERGTLVPPNDSGALAHAITTIAEGPRATEREALIDFPPSLWPRVLTEAAS